MSKYHMKKNYDVVVVGGGLSGVCAAIASARNGAKTAIVQNRSMFGICALTPEQCIKNMASIGINGMKDTDQEILRLMKDCK